MPNHYFYLIIAIATEVIATSALNASHQFTRIVPTLIMAMGYGCSLYFMSMTFKFMPVGVVYAIWSGLGIVLIGVVGYAVFGQKLDLAAIMGMGLIIMGVLVIHLFSSSATH